MCVIYILESKKIGALHRKGGWSVLRSPAQQRSTRPRLNVVTAAQLSSDKNRLAALAKNHPRK